MNLDNKNFLCTGCFLCHDVCPVNAIAIITNNEGFYEYKIDEEKCIKCGKCVSVCPKLIHKFKNNPMQDCYAAYSKNKNVVLNSSSGGIFTELANCILDQKGYVVGAVWIDKKIKHIIIDNKKDLDELRKSKYLQSNLENIYSKIQELIKNDKLVLFSGTPCQVGALNNLVQSDNLYTIDIVCHGVPSSKVFETSLIQRFNKVPQKIDFRNKVKSWNLYQIKYDEKKINFIEDGWMKNYLNNSFLKKDCYDCPFVKDNKRVGDLSLGDFWGIDKIDFEFFKMNKDTGISNVIINNPKGQKLFNKIKSNIIYKKQDLELSYQHNPRINNGKYNDQFLEKRKIFFKLYSNNKFKFKNDNVVNKFKKYLSKTKNILKTKVFKNI